MLKSEIGKEMEDFRVRKDVRIRRIDERISCIFLTKPNQQWSNTYLIEDEDLTLIDTGRPESFSANALKKSLFHLGYCFNDIKTIIFTHAHIDHIGGAIALADILTSKNIAYYEAKEKLQDFSRFNKEWIKEFISLLSKCSLSVQQGFAQSPTYELLKFPELKGGITIHRGVREGDLIDIGKTKLVVYHTPGHSPWDISLYESEKKFLFTGDFITSPQTVFVSTMGSNLDDYLNSLEKVSKISIDCMFPGHGKFSKNPYRLFEKAREQIRQYEDLILDELRNCPMTLHGITSALFNGCNDPGIQLFNYGRVDTFLIKLKREKRISLDNEGKFWTVSTN
ncbi:MAG: MBL fold metallo-hydrolase [Thermodesulfobacteriota bacterium]|nr:MBL fold metallo-hydrolase [Thermodesulfobacteriota bacterium]